MPRAPAKPANQNVLRSLPSIDALPRTPPCQALRNAIGAEQAALLARIVTEELRMQILGGALETRDSDASMGLLEKAMLRLAALHEKQIGTGLHRVIKIGRQHV